MLDGIDLRNAVQSTFDEIMKPKRHGCFPVVHFLSSRSNYGMLPFMQSIAEVNSMEFTKGGRDQESMTPEEQEENKKYADSMKKQAEEANPGVNFISPDELGPSMFNSLNGDPNLKSKSKSSTKSKSNSKYTTKDNKMKTNFKNSSSSSSFSSTKHNSKSYNNKGTSRPNHSTKSSKMGSGNSNNFKRTSKNAN